jgi:hypothetical protein
MNRFLLILLAIAFGLAPVSRALAWGSMGAPMGGAPPPVVSAPPPVMPPTSVTITQPWQTLGRSVLGSPVGNAAPNVGDEALKQAETVADAVQAKYDELAAELLRQRLEELGRTGDDGRGNNLSNPSQAFVANAFGSVDFAHEPSLVLLWKSEAVKQYASLQQTNNKIAADAGNSALLNQRSQQALNLNNLVERIKAGAAILNSQGR